ncbi:MAG: leucine-rich repeat domain-containing protein [Chitinophagales bacterium]|jgi:Leucine-rich repeat (LRR) protein|nr:leucine-rich repeat domain-containing protein [Sphingobacteriales bacterium]
MKNYYKIKIVAILFALFINIHMQAQAKQSDSSNVYKEYNNLEDALKNPEKVYRLNLSNQKIKFPSDSIWSKFSNLEYLSLKNDHLQEIPSGIGNLRKLKTLDLGGNDFKYLPSSFSKLSNLSEIYLNDDKNLDINQSFSVLKDLPQLKILHLENDLLKKLPKSILFLDKIEYLYLNNNELKEFPSELIQLKNLKYLDLHDNKFRLKHPDNEKRESFKTLLSDKYKKWPF